MTHRFRKSDVCCLPGLVIVRLNVVNRPCQPIIIARIASTMAIPATWMRYQISMPKIKTRTYGIRESSGRRRFSTPYEIADVLLNRKPCETIPFSHYAPLTWNPGSALPSAQCEHIGYTPMRVALRAAMRCPLELLALRDRDDDGIWIQVGLRSTEYLLCLNMCMRIRTAWKCCLCECRLAGRAMVDS